MVSKISVLGSTGSIGKKALAVADNLGISVCGLAVFNNIDLLEQQIIQFEPKIAAVFDEESAQMLRDKARGIKTKIVSGIDGLCEVAALPEVDMMLNAVSGMIGLQPTLCAIDAGKDVAIANKETLVAGGALVMQRARQVDVRILPVDSEHSAIFQCLQGCSDRHELNRLILTASGGPFWGRSRESLQTVTKEDTLNHPNWSMGPKVTVDSATMMNKGLEVIEAAWLFGVSPQNIDVLIHRESIVHSMVEFTDHSIIAQMAVPDMTIPIQYALTYPKRMPSLAGQLNLPLVTTLTFDKLNEEVFKGVSICKSALKVGGTMPAIVNSANEKPVSLFLNDKISFLQITDIVQKAMEVCKAKPITGLSDIINADKTAREFVRLNILSQGE